ncbi:LysR family transcriptional regulator [Paracandidimonas soli]|uniref:LysR family transcriptional regulator n=1 Tax=Paracandidimonas soli TaxID=1917182 RepID=UPI003341B9C1
MEIRQLECFIAAAEELHFGRAAKRLHMTQPPLSRQIQRLEDSLGTALFDRSSRHVQLTISGRAFLREARHLLEAFKRAKESARQASKGETGHLALGFTAVAAYRLVPDLLKRTQALLPHIKVHLHEMVTTDLGKALTANDLDLVIARDIPQEPGLISSPLTREPMVLAMPDDSALARHSCVPLSALHRQAFIQYHPKGGRYFHNRIVGLFNIVGIQPSIVQMASQTHTLLFMIRAGIGIGIVPSSAQELHLPGVAFRPLAPPNIFAEFHLGWHENHANPALSAFLDKIIVPDQMDAP